MTPELLQERLKAGVCIACGHPFTDKNVHSTDGWRETRISNMCEDCFDECAVEDE